MPLYDPLLLVLNSECLTLITLRYIINSFGTPIDEETAQNRRETDRKELQLYYQAEIQPEIKDECEADDDSDSGELELRLLALARKIGNRCEINWRSQPRRFKSQVFLEYLERYKTNRAERRAESWAILSNSWSIGYRNIHLGRKLLLLAAATKVLQLDRPAGDRYDSPRPNFFRLSDSFRDLLRKREAEADALAAPFYRPMIIRPKRWKSLKNGGYLNNQGRRGLHLVKHKQDPAVMAGLQEARRTGDLSATFAAVNALQETAWRINKKVLGVMRSCKEQNDGRKSFRLPGAKVLNRKLKTAQGMEDEDEIFFPCQLDFRGRIYSLPQEVNPQSDDAGRSLLEFATGKALGPAGIDWLKVHIAGCWAKAGIDKAPFAARRRWVDENSAKIVACARDPMKERWWMSGDRKKSWRFLAGCFEWEACCSGGTDFKSRLPIAMDGTCNGLQHLSALRRDEKGGKSTNLVPGETKADIYEEVAIALQQALEIDQQKGIAGAIDWLEHGKINRDLIKRAVMTTPYGVKRRGIAKQLTEMKSSKNLTYRAESCRYLARKLQICIGKIVDPQK